MSRFLVDLSIALHRFAMYPPGHPALASVLDTVGRRVEALLQDRSRIAIGVARDRLVIEGVVTDAGHALLRTLADRLHRHHLSALSIYRGVSLQELSELIVAVGQDPARGAPLGRTVLGADQPWPHVGLHPLTVGSLEMVNADRAETAQPGRGAVLWVGLAQAALGRDPSEASTPAETEPVAVARAIDDHQQVDAYDQVIVGYLQQIADEVRVAETAETQELRRRVSTLVSTMHPATLQRLLQMGGDSLRRHQFVRAASAGLSAGAVVDLVKAAAEASDQALSSGLVRLLSKLAAHADAGQTRVQPLADSALRLQVSRLFSGWELPDPNPQDYGNLLENIARASNTPAHVSTGTGVVGAQERLRIVQICLDTEAEGPALWRSIDGLVDDGAVATLVDLLHPAPAGGVAAMAWQAVASARTVQKVLARVPPDFAAVDALLPHLAADALGPLFDLMLDSGDRHFRRAAFDRLRTAGRRAAESALGRLDDDRWYAIRNLLALLAEIDGLPDTCDPLPWLAHPDARVRREALRVSLRLDRLRQQAVLAGLADADERVVRVAAHAASTSASPAVVGRLMELARGEIADDELRTVVIEALVRAHRGRGTRDLLLHIVSSDGSWLRWPARDKRNRSAASAVAALAAHWPRDPAVVPVLRRAALSDDPAIRRAVKVARP